MPYQLIVPATDGERAREAIRQAGAELGVPNPMARPPGEEGDYLTFEIASRELFERARALLGEPPIEY